MERRKWGIDLISDIEGNLASRDSGTYFHYSRFPFSSVHTLKDRSVSSLVESVSRLSLNEQGNKARRGKNSRRGRNEDRAGGAAVNFDTTTAL